MSYTDSSNGVTPASLEVDYVGLHIGLSVDAQAVLAKSGFDSSRATQYPCGKSG